MNTIKLKSAALAFTAAFGITAATLLATAGAAHAAESTAPAYSVLHRDLDLSTDKGRDKLQSRILRAATKACIDPREANPALRAARRGCVVEAIAKAGPSIDRAVQRDIAQRDAPRAASLVTIDKEN